MKSDSHFANIMWKAYYAGIFTLHETQVIAECVQHISEYQDDSISDILGDSLKSVFDELRREQSQ